MILFLFAGLRSISLHKSSKSKDTVKLLIGGALARLSTNWSMVFPLFTQKIEASYSKK